MNWSKEILILATSSIFSIVLTNLGIQILNENSYIGIITILIGFSPIYITYYTTQISTNDKEIQELEERVLIAEQVLNTLKEIVILKQVGKIR